MMSARELAQITESSAGSYGAILSCNGENLRVWLIHGKILTLGGAILEI